MSVAFTTLFTRLGRFFAVGDAVNVALGATVDAAADDALQGLGSSLPVEYEIVRNGVLDGLEAFQDGGNEANSALVQIPAQNLIRLTVADDDPVSSTLDLAIRQLIKQMEDAGQSLDAAVVSASVSYDGSNIGTGTVLVSTKRADGRDCLLAFGEQLDFVCTSENDDGTAGFDFLGEPLIGALSPLWPGGSGATGQVTSLRGSSGGNLVPNGTFELSDDNSDDLPLGWLAITGTLGTTIKMGDVEIQTVAISGTPTDGYYTLSWTNAAGKVQTTLPLAWDASGSDVQTALQSLVGLESVTVETSGTSPNVTHTITFTDVTAPSQLTSTNSLDTGSIAHATPTAGSANVFRGARCVEFDSNGAEFTKIMVPVTLAPQTQYAINLFAKADVVPAAGVLKVDLVDGIGGSVVDDDQGVDNSITITATTLTTSFTPQSGSFRTPSILPPIVYLRIRISTFVSSTSSIFLDDVYLGPMTELYTDGPSVAIFDGSVEFETEDLATVTVSQDRGGAIHEWLDRVLSLRESRLLFPTNSMGTETISDSLIVDLEGMLITEGGEAILTETGVPLLIE